MIDVLTGGQTGVDTGALLAAKAVGYKWGCLLPAGYKREEELPDWMLAECGKKVGELTGVTDYASRTKQVVSHADLALVITPDEGVLTPGTKLTLSELKAARVPTWRFMSISDRAAWKAEAHAIAYWLRTTEWLFGELDVTLNVAGPRAGKWAEGEHHAQTIVGLVLAAHKEDRPPNPRKKRG